MLSCREVAHLVASDADAGAGWRVRLSVCLHQAMCRHCKRYAAQLRAIGDAMRERNLAGGDVEQPVKIPSRVHKAIDAGARGHLGRQ